MTTPVEPRTQRLLTFARILQRAGTLGELFSATRDEAEHSVGYRHVWFMLADDEDAEELRLIEMAGEQRELVWNVAPLLKVKGDRFLEELVASDVPVVIEDARTDPRTNKQIVEALQNRTLINIPLRLLDKPLGIFGLGTFGDEGCRVPNEAELDYLIGMASQLTVAASRIRLVEARARAAEERQEMERKMLQAQKLESLGLLAGGIAHDFNNLLTVILASANLAEQELPDGPPRTEIQAVIGAASRARDLVRQLLAMSRTQELQLKTLELNAQLSKLVRLIARILPETIEVDLIEGSSLPLVEGDASQIDQVFMNLIINARDAMPQGGRLTIETEQVLVNGEYVRLHPWAQPGRYVLVTVTDTGTGMAPQVAERIFEPFFTTKGDRVGTGLGLAVCYGVVRQHGGVMHCYSEVDVGTSIKVYLPVVERFASDVGTKLQATPVKGHEAVLVAEDDELVRGVAVRVLERGGYRVTAVADGEAACRAVTDGTFDLVILDVVMPGMACHDLMDRIYAIEPKIRIMLSSGYTGGSNVTALSERTGMPLLRKPYDPDAMLRAVRAALDCSQTA